MLKYTLKNLKNNIRLSLKILWHDIKKRWIIALVLLFIFYFSSCLIHNGYFKPIGDANIISLTIGFAGFIFGLMSYNISRQVEESIRSPITNLNDFIIAANQIIDEEILVSYGKALKFPHHTSIAINSKLKSELKNEDLILILWFPYYGLTKDFYSNEGSILVEKLLSIQYRNCKTCFISSKNPFELMAKFDTQYNNELKNYNSGALYTIIKEMSDKSILAFEETDITILKNTYNTEEYSILLDGLETLHRIYSPPKKETWKTISVDNGILMSGLVQLIWTKRKAAIVFMPPDSYTNISSYECKGFSTSDTSMVEMIYDLANLLRNRFKENGNTSKKSDKKSNPRWWRRILPKCKPL